MIKTLLIVTAMSSGGFEYKTEMPSMESCMEARTLVQKQNDEVSTLCVPYNDGRSDDPEKEIRGVFDLFFNLIERVEKIETKGSCTKEGL
jgi:hypothetical protein